MLRFICDIIDNVAIVEQYDARDDRATYGLGAVSIDEYDELINLNL